MSPAQTHSSPTRPVRLRGITALELLVTVLIAALLLTLAAPSFRAQFDRQRVKAAASEIASDVQLARLEAIALREPVRISFHANGEGSCYLLHTGPQEGCTCSPSADAEPAATACADAAAAKLIKAVALPAAQRVQLSANVASLRFDPILGTSTPAGTLQVAAAGERVAIRHVVNLLGRVRSCAPQGPMPGYPAC